MTFKRNITKDLEEWRASENHKPLIIRGARQVGKSTVVREFGKRFDTFIPLNLEMPSDRKLFDSVNDVRTTFKRICYEKKVNPEGDVLLFLDEIQNSVEAVSMLRYFYEEMPEIYVISAGSLLELMMEKTNLSFPVGRVTYLYLYPMGFVEFLEAAGEFQAIELLNEVPFPSWAEDSLFRLFRTYMMVGGMPEAVAAFLENKGNILACSKIYDDLFASYNGDTAKYARNKSESEMLQTLIEAAPSESGKRITFEKFAATNFRSREVGAALRTLERAMLLYLRYPTTGLDIPLQTDPRKKPRLQFLDIGLMNYRAGVQGLYLRDEPIDGLYGGNLAEQAVFQERMAAENRYNGKPLFWVRESPSSNAELDFLLIHGSEVIPVEVKAGKSGRLRSLHSFVDLSGAKKAVRLYSGPLLREETHTASGKPYTLINLPLFLADRIEKYL